MAGKPSDQAPLLKNLSVEQRRQYADALLISIWGELCNAIADGNLPKVRKLCDGMVVNAKQLQQNTLYLAELPEQDRADLQSRLSMWRSDLVNNCRLLREKYKSYVVNEGIARRPALRRLLSLVLPECKRLQEIWEMLSYSASRMESDVVRIVDMRQSEGYAVELISQLTGLSEKTVHSKTKTQRALFGQQAAWHNGDVYAEPSREKQSAPKQAKTKRRPSRSAMPAKKRQSTPAARKKR